MGKVSKQRNYFVSVAMTTYNGEKYIKEQIDSVLENLRENDELIISDDGSTDSTLNIIKKYKDRRIKLYDGPHQGFKKNYEFCFSKCNGKYIFMCDQDDIWVNNKIDIVLKVFEETKCDCVTHDAIVVNAENSEILQESFMKERFMPKPGIISNIAQSKYYGCLMAFDKKLLNHALPIPESIVSHDYWIGLLADKYGKSIFIDDKLIRYRRHNSNSSTWGQHMSVWKMITKRVNIFINIIKR